MKQPVRCISIKAYLLFLFDFLFVYKWGPNFIKRIWSKCLIGLFFICDYINAFVCALVSLCGGKTSWNIVPVDDVKNGLNIVQANIFVLQIVSMFPDIDTQQWNQTYGEKICFGNEFRFTLEQNFTHHEYKKFMQTEKLTGGGFQWILIEACSNLNLVILLVESKPSPSRSLNGNCCGGEFFFKIFKTSVCLFQFALQCTRRFGFFRA